jgi:hypothetical protein
MHANQVEFFKAIQYGEIDNFKKQMLSENFAEIAPWILNEKNESAFDYALNHGRTEMVNIFLTVLSQKTDRFAYTYALVRATQKYCSPLEDLKDYFALYKNPESQFTFLNTQWTYWDLAVSANTAKTIQAATDLLVLKPEIQQLIRALMGAKMLTDFFKKQNPPNLVGAAQLLLDSLSYWVTDPMFNEHSHLLMSWFKPTNTVTMLTRMRKACALIVKKKENLLDTDLAIEDASNILLLCSKCYPFCTGFLAESFAQLANDILAKFDDQPKNLITLFEAIADKQWLRTDNHVPLTAQSLLNTLPQNKIRSLMRAHGHENSSIQLRENRTLMLKAESGMDVLGLYPCQSSKKQLELSSPCDETIKNYLHLLLMNNAQLSLKFKGTEIFEQNILSQFYHVPCEINFVISDSSQIPHVGAQLSILHATHPKLRITFSNKMLLDEIKVIDLLECRRLLGPKQSITAEVVDTLEQGRMLTDMEVLSDQFKAGPWIRSQLNNHSKEDTQTKIQTFREFYSRLPWNSCLEANTLPQQMDAIEAAQREKKPLIFVFNQCSYDPDLFSNHKLIFQSSPEICLIRFDNAAGQTVCDFVITPKGALRPGPLCDLISCTEPGLYLSSTEHMARVRKDNEIGARSSLEFTEDDMRRLGLGQS